MKTLTQAALKWWDLLSLEDKQNKTFHYCTNNDISSMEFEISHIVDIFKSENPNLITSAEQLEELMGVIFSEPLPLKKA